MSLGPSSLSHLLVQRLDSALGVTPSAQNRTGAHPDALRQTQPPHRLHPNEKQPLQAEQEGVDKSRPQGRHTNVGRQDARVAVQLKSYTDSRFTASAPTTLGPTARTILSLLNHYQNQPVPGRQPLMLPQQLAPLTGQTLSTTSLVSALTQALTQNVQQSGMFYESQLARLLKGQADLAQLRQQPQAQIQTHAQSQTQAQKADSALQSTNQNTKNTSTQTPTARGAEPAASSTLQQAGIDPAAQQLVRQQLDVLANQLFTWRGEAWPGAMMEWDIQRRHEDESSEKNTASANSDEVLWQTRLRVDLPHLGEVETRLYIEDKKLRLHIHAPAAANQLMENKQQLIQRLQAQGLQIDQFQISHQDELTPDPPLYVHEPE